MAAGREFHNRNNAKVCEDVKEGFSNFKLNFFLSLVRYLCSVGQQ